MKRILNQTQRVLFLALIIIFQLAFLVSCKEKAVINQEKEFLEEKTVTQPFLTLDTNIIPNDTFVDLFYQGQLAHWVRSIHQDKHGNLWLGTNHYGVIQRDEISMKYHTDDTGIIGSRINEIIEDTKGNVWIASSQGITKHDGKEFMNYTTQHGLIHNAVQSIELDNKGGLWIGTLEGVSYFDGNSFTNFTVQKADLKNVVPMLSKNRITNILEDSKGNIWFGTDGYGISKYDGKGFTFYTTEDGLPGTIISDLLADSQGNIWIGTMYGGISRFDGTSFTNFTKEGIIKGEETGALFEDSKGNIWFSAEHQGAFRFNGTSFDLFSEKDGLVSNGIIAIHEDRQGIIWLGGWKGLSSYNGTSFTTITQKLLHK